MHNELLACDVISFFSNVFFSEKHFGPHFKPLAPPTKLSFSLILYYIENQIWPYGPLVKFIG